MRINFSNLGRRLKNWSDYDHWKVVLDPYRDWRRLLFFAGLGITVIIGGALYMAVALERGQESAGSVSAASSTTISLLLDRAAIDQAASLIFDQQTEFNSRLESLLPRGVEPRSTP